MKVGIVGLGNLGSAVACLAANNGYSVLAWEFNAAVIDDVNAHKHNERFLPGVVFPDAVKATDNLSDVFNKSDIVFIALPSRFLQSVLADVAELSDKFVGIVNLAKGIDAKTGKTAMQLLSEIFQGRDIAMLSGPSLANEFSRGILTGVVAASENDQLLKQISEVLNNDRFAVMFSDDIVGVELGGILKNIYALGMGIFYQREDAGLNFIGAYLTQSLAEMKNLAVALGARPESFFQLSGIGDLIATSLSHDSHNFTMGKYIANGLSLQQIENKMRVLPEGYNTIQIVLKLAEEKNVDMPMAALLWKIIHAEISVETFYGQFAGLMKSQQIESV